MQQPIATAKLELGARVEMEDSNLRRNKIGNFCTRVQHAMAEPELRHFFVSNVFAATAKRNLTVLHHTCSCP
jgi:hypothetical protein